MPKIRRRALLGAVSAVTLSSPALAFPDRTLRIISGFPPGGLNDIIARALAQPLSAELGQAVVVENRGGAGGSVGATAAARSAPDGHALWMGIVDTQAINPFAYRNLQYDPDRDFAPISMVGRFPFALIVGPSRPGIQSFPQLIDAARPDPEGVTYASWGVASTPHLAMERILAQQGVRMLHVPFTGQAPAMQAILAGQVDCFALPAGGAESLTRDGRSRAVAVLAPGEVPLFPGVPTVKSFGAPLESGLWKAIYAPARTPAPVIAQLNAAVRRAMTNAAFIEVVRQQGAVPEPSTPEFLAAFQRDERRAWGDVVRSTNALVE
ncbi:Bug family tripartite tricarboxylate transporter substrate binding protein [Plastoroseomonas arctica]|uniref:Tripartite tricarboxylate transporter substrate binding protein n=1 Tax=Plastoroseomonas arctica TaxID=1509237 RepID=A0AAF1KMY9_9PROT|nr:tripartite tricarboxylate transporter substrate binding protein [Plastoroseomonas arctica]MBR0656966.1 tripartite tricarboxylate transporter substrate binding protein [Plastoroseomonas arctica]